MHYKTRTYLYEAVIVKSTGCDMNEVWSMYAKISFCRLKRSRPVTWQLLCALQHAARGLGRGLLLQPR